MEKRKNGLGYVSQIAKGKYRLRKQVGILPNGRPRIFTVTGTSETDCLKKMKNKENEAKDNLLLTDDDTYKKITVTDLCMAHFNEHLSEKDRLKPKAADRRESTINNQIKKYSIGKMQAIGVAPKDVKDHIELLIKENKLSVSSISKALDVINGAYKWAVDHEHLKYNPCVPVLEELRARLRKLDEKKSSDGIVVVLSDNQCIKIEDAVNQMKNTAKTYEYLFGLSVLLLLKTGMRAGEMCSLRWRDYREASGTLNISKTRNITKHRYKNATGYKPNENEVKNYHSRTIALNKEAQVVLNEMKRITHRSGADDYIVVNMKDNPSNPSNYGNNLNKFYSKIGLGEEVTGAHILRRTCATKMHNEGCMIEDIAAYLGDAKETILKHYISLTKKIVSDGEVLNVVQFPSSKNNAPS